MVTIADYGMGNVGSIANMFRRLNINATLAHDAETIAVADRLILPGVGSFDEGMANLEKLGLRDVLDRRVIHDKVPVLGICLGMQLMTKGSEEGVKPGLGWIDAHTVEKMRKVPLCDLALQAEGLKPEQQKAVEKVFTFARYILGPEG